MNEALLLTQYEKYGSVDMQDYINMYIDEFLEVDYEMIGAYNEYLNENHYESFISFDEINDHLCDTKPSDIIRLVAYGSVNMSDDYLRFDGYGNLESYSEDDVIKEMKDDTEFLRWYVDKECLIDEDEAQEIIDEANRLIQEGY